MGHRITTNEETKVRNIVKGRGHEVTYIPPVALALVLIIFVVAAIFIAKLLSNLPAGVIMFSLFGA